MRTPVGSSIPGRRAWCAGNGTIGGLVGTNATNDGAGTIINSYTTGRLDRAWNYGVHFVGSLVGRNGQ